MMVSSNCQKHSKAWTEGERDGGVMLQLLCWPAWTLLCTASAALTTKRKGWRGRRETKRKGIQTGLLCRVCLFTCEEEHKVSRLSGAPACLIHKTARYSSSLKPPETEMLQILCILHGLWWGRGCGAVWGAPFAHCFVVTAWKECRGGTGLSSLAQGGMLTEQEQLLTWTMGCHFTLSQKYVLLMTTSAEFLKNTSNHQRATSPNHKEKGSSTEGNVGSIVTQDLTPESFHGNYKHIQLLLSHKEGYRNFSLIKPIHSIEVTGWTNWSVINQRCAEQFSCFYFTSIFLTSSSLPSFSALCSEQLPLVRQV